MSEFGALRCLGYHGLALHPLTFSVDSGIARHLLAHQPFPLGSMTLALRNHPLLFFRLPAQLELVLAPLFFALRLSAFTFEAERPDGIIAPLLELGPRAANARAHSG